MLRALTTVVVSVFVLTGCSNAADDVKDPATTSQSPSASSSPSDDSPSPTEPVSPSDDAIEIEIEGGNISPKGNRVEVDTGKAITLKIDSDRAGELHVHSTPEQELSFKKGKSTVELTIETPGIVDVEEHETGVVVLQLEVS